MTQPYHKGGLLATHKISCMLSTQSHLKDLTAQMSPFQTTVVSTQNQDQGHGRRGNHWLKCQNALAFSLLFPFQPHLHLPRLNWAMTFANF